MDVDFSLREGLSLDTESLENIARGGVSFLTTGSDGIEVVPGQVFTLHEQLDDQWEEQANRVRLPTVKLKGTVTLVIKTTRSGLLGSRETTRLVSAIPARFESGKTGLVVPANILSEFSPKSTSAKSISIDGFSDEALDASLFEKLIALAGDKKAVDGKEYESSFAIIVVPIESSPRLPWQELGGIDDQPLIAVRRPVGATNGVFVHQPISWQQLTTNGADSWRLSGFDGDPDLWNGSSILGADSGEVIGMLVSHRRGAEIVSLNATYYADSE